MGILIGIGVKLLIHVINGVPLWALFKPYLDIEVKDDDTAVIRARHSAVFSNWILFRSKIIQLGLVERRNVVVDFSQCKLVDHSVMEKVHELERDFEDANLHLAVEGLEGHKALSHHDFAARKQAMTRLQRVTVVADESLEESLIREFVKLGASGYTSIPCPGAGRRSLAEGDGSSSLQIRLEAVVLQEVADQILDYLRAEVAPNHRITACVEAVEVLRQDNF